jgi:hypothetical protein
VLEIADSVARDKTTVSASGSGRDEDKMFCVVSRVARAALASPALKDEHSESTDSDDKSSHVSASREERTTRDCDCDCENGAGGLFTFRAKDFDARRRFSSFAAAKDGFVPEIETPRAGDPLLCDSP